MATTATRKRKTKTIDLHWAQSEAYTAEERIVAFIGGTGSGKTFFAPIWQRQEIEKYPKDAHLIVAPTYKMLHRNTLFGTHEHPGWLRMNADIVKRYHESKGYIELTTGGIVYVGSADNPLSIEGPHVRSVILDEAGQMSRLMYIVALSRAAYHFARIGIFTTPYSMNWLHKDIFLKARACRRCKDRKKCTKKACERGDKSIKVIQCTSIDNPHYSREAYEDAKVKLGEAIFAMRFRGQFERAESLIYALFYKTVVEDYELDESFTRMGGVDFGYYPNPTVIVHAALDTKSEDWHCYREDYLSKALLQQIADILLEAEEEDDIEQWYGDPSAKREIEELQALGVSIVAADNAVDYGIEQVNGLIRTGHWHTFETCANLIDEAEMYQRDEKAKVIKKNDHGLDAVRYMVRGWQEMGASSPLRVISLKGDKET